jgi:pyruvate dehydrogenase E2 component (dihydrolipoamide acetyltransferase)
MGRVVVDLALPRLGETMDEGRIGQLLKKPGQIFRRGETLLEVESDKTTVEVPALQDGVLVEWLVASDQVVPVESAIARIEIDLENVAQPKGRIVDPAQGGNTPVRPVIPRRALPSGPRVRASTAARATARKSGTDLGGITGTGRNGRITRADLASLAAPQRSTYRLRTENADFFVRDWPAAGVEKGAVLLLHGLFAESQSFTTLGRKLAANGFRSLALDLPGHGETQSSLTGASAMAEAVNAALPSGRFHVVGHSFGAVVSTILAAQHRDRAASLTLLAPGGVGDEISGSFLESMLTGQFDEALKFLGEAVPLEAVATLADQINRNRAQLRQIVGGIADAGRQRRSIVSLLPDLKVPVTAVFMRDDPVIPVAQALNLPSNVSVRFVPGASHLPHWRFPDLIVRVLLEHAAVA